MTTTLKKKIDQLKEDYGRRTSEELFEITPPATYQCPNIDALIKKAREIESLCSYNYYDEDIEPLREQLNDINHLISDFESELEEFRTAIEQVRSWGSEWKDVAKQVIEHNDVNLTYWI